MDHVFIGEYFHVTLLQTMDIKARRLDIEYRVNLMYCILEMNV